MYPIDKDLVVKLIREKIDLDWMRDMIKGKKGIHGVGGHGDMSRAEHFMHLLWDNLTEEQQQKVIEALNLIIEEDLYKPVVFGSYYQDLIGMVCMIEKKIAGSMNSSLILKWKNEGFPNLAKPKNYSSSLQAEFIQKIENAFLKK